jgi:large subunit ribosomal protein L21
MKRFREPPVYPEPFRRLKNTAKMLPLGARSDQVTGSGSKRLPSRVLRRKNAQISFAHPTAPCHFPGLYQLVAMAYAIIRSGNKQYRVAPGETVAVEKLSGQAGEKITFAEVVLHCDGDKVTLGAPLIDGAKVSGEVVEQFKDKKVIAFKYRRRKGYHRTVGHRRQLTRVKIGSIDL